MYYTIMVCFFRANWVKVNGITYRPSNIIVLGVEDDYPKFGKVLAVYVVGANRILLDTEILLTEGHAHHFHGYTVRHSGSEHKLLCLRDLYIPFPLDLRRVCYQGSTMLLVVTKYHICKAV